MTHNMADDVNDPDPEPDSLREAVQGQLRSRQDCVPSRLFEFESLGLGYEEFVRGVIWVCS